MSHEKLDPDAENNRPHGKWTRLVDFAESFCLCPCCDENRKCHDECTYKEDAKPEKYELMIKAREALIEAGVL